MAHEQPLKLKKVIQNIKVGDYLQFLYPNLSREELERKIKENINQEFDFYTETKKGNQKYISVYTKKNIYQIKNQTIINRFNRLKMRLEKIELKKEIRKESLIIHPQVIDKFKNKNIEKIEEVIHRFIEEGEIQSIKENKAFMTHKQQEVILIIDFHNQVIRDILTYKKYHINSNALLIEGDKMKIDTELEGKKIKQEVFLNQLNLLSSNIVNSEEAIEDIRKNLKTIEVDEEEDKLFIHTKNCIYAIKNYNILDFRPEKGFKIGSAKPIDLTDFTMSAINKQNIEFITEVPVQEMYGNLEKARKYLYRLGLSIKVITKFITEDNIQELYDFIIEDMVNYGYVLYDNYMDNCMIIKSQRFYYLIKNSVIINLKTFKQEHIPECSILFQKVYIQDKSEKTHILDLEVGDRLRDYITYDVVKNLRMKEHAKERYRERISKKEDSSFIEMTVKQDIYKYGTVYMGTYYDNTKLIKGLKNIYIIDNYNIISVWRINPVIETIGERYQNLIDEITMTEVDDSEII